MTDAEAVRAALSGDQDAYTLLYGRLRPLVARMAGRFFRSTAAAVDYEADCLAHILLRLHKWDGAAKLTTWAHRVAINQALMRKRSLQHRAGDVSLDEQVGGAGSATSYAELFAVPGNQFVAMQARMDVEMLMAKLPPKLRSALAAAHIDGASAKEYAARQGISVSAAKSRIARGKREAREIFGKRIRRKRV